MPPTGDLIPRIEAAKDKAELVKLATELLQRFRDIYHLIITPQHRLELRVLIERSEETLRGLGVEP